MAQHLGEYLWQRLEKASLFCPLVTLTTKCAKQNSSPNAEVNKDFILQS
jgi:hypothetical protein